MEKEQNQIFIPEVDIPSPPSHQRNFSEGLSAKRPKTQAYTQRVYTTINREKLNGSKNESAHKKAYNKLDISKIQNKTTNFAMTSKSFYVSNIFLFFQKSTIGSTREISNMKSANTMRNSLISYEFSRDDRFRVPKKPDPDHYLEVQEWT